MEGLVVKSTGSWYEIEDASRKRFQARLKGKLRTEGLKSTNPVAVGDKVDYVIEGEDALITAVNKRKNYIIRKSINLSKQTQIIAANVDQVLLFVTLQSPVTTMAFVDRFLIGAEAYGVPVILVFNKMDLIQSKDGMKLLDRWKTVYHIAGYPCVETSVIENKGLEEIKALMQGKISIFSGHSGVGKSSLVNAIAPEMDLRVNEISDYHQAGKHTTTFAELFHLPFGASIIDTPGIKGFANVNMQKEELSHYFPEMRERLNQCKYHNCVHINEPQCAIKEAVQSGQIAESRYLNYVTIFEEDEEENYRQKGY